MHTVSLLRRIRCFTGINDAYAIERTGSDKENSDTA